ncbi:MAG: cytochrome P450 [Pseudomonadota bacterium]
MQPRDPIAAVTHPDPYPYYDQLLERAPLHFDSGLNAWIASRAEVIEEVLGNPECRVRPLTEPVPKAILGDASGDIFARLIRMNEGAAHADGKRIVGRALAAIDAATVTACASEAAIELARDRDLDDVAALNAWIAALPAWTVARLLGIGRPELGEIGKLTAAFVQCLSPLAGPEQLAHADSAARALRGQMDALLGAQREAGSLLDHLTRQPWLDHDGLCANLVGLLSQSHDATAGLIGNSVVHLLRAPHTLNSLRAEQALAANVVRHVIRFDPPVHNTRRFVGAPTAIAQQLLQRGEAIVLVLAADRRGGKQLGFGAGHHACPGQNMASIIATSALSYLLTTHRLPDSGTTGWRYRPSVNARLPLFYSRSAKGTP